MTTEWKLVPVEPTREQLDAAKNALIFDPRVSACAYREMLAAAPVPPAGGEVEVLGYLVSCYSTQLSKAPGGTDDETVELVDRAHVTRLTAERDALQAYVGRLKAGPDHFCGGPMSINPHAEAGVPGRYLEVGAVRECIPCLVKSRHDWANKANALQSELTKARELLQEVAEEDADKYLMGSSWHERLAHQSAPAAKEDE